MEILEEDHYFYKLSRDEKTDEYFHEVTCGRTAVFDITIKLTANEIAEYRGDPTSIRVLAYWILDDPDAYIRRRI